MNAVPCSLVQFATAAIIIADLTMWGIFIVMKILGSDYRAQRVLGR